MRAPAGNVFWRPTVVVMLVLVVIGGAAGGVAALLVPHSYQSTSRVFVSSTAGSVQTLQELPKLDLRDQVTGSFAQVATTPLVLQRVVDRLGLRMTPGALVAHVSARASSGTAVIGITVSDPSAAQSARIANAIGAALVAVSPSLTPKGASGAPTRLAVVGTATATDAASSVNLVACIGLGAVVGLLVALVVLIVRAGRPGPPRGSRRSVWTPTAPGEPA